jgi:predicted dehydrogenase
MNEVRIGIAGISGHQIHGLLPDLSRARITDLVNVPPADFETLAEMHPYLRDAVQHPTLEELLAHGSADLISFCSQRREEQGAHCLAALRAGKHVLAEKPMANSIEQLLQLRQAVADSGTELRTMTMMIYEPDFGGVKAVIESNAIGQTVQCHAMKSYPFIGSRPQDRGVDGGIMQAAIHAISIIRFVTGLEFESVFAHDTLCGNPTDGDLQMAATISGKLSSGALANIVANYCNPPGVGYWGNDQLRIHGTAGMIELVDGLRRRALACGDQPPETFEDCPAAVRFPQDLIDCILDGTPTLLSMEDSFRNTEVALAAQESADTGIAMSTTHEWS